MIKGSIPQEDTTILNLNVLKNIGLKCINQKSREL